MISQTKRTEIMEAFVSSKAYEFNGFLLRYMQEHPEEAATPVAAVIVAAEEKPVAAEPVSVETPKTTTKAVKKVEAAATDWGASK